MAKQTKKMPAKITTTHRGKKGGLSLATPEVMGAMAGAAIGGVAGLMLANEKTREKLAVVKDQAIDAAGKAMENVHVDTSGIDEGVKTLSSKATRKIAKSTSKK